MAIVSPFDSFSAQADDSSWFPDALTAHNLIAEYNASIKQQHATQLPFDHSRLSPSQHSSTTSDSMSPNDSSGSGVEGSHTPTAWKERRDSNLILKRSHSTPTVKSMALSSNALDQSAQGEKKRNKLGYHRTSIACSMYPSFYVNDLSWRRLTLSRPLQTKKNSMYCLGRYAKQVYQLRSLEEGL